MRLSTDSIMSWQTMPPARSSGISAQRKKAEVETFSGYIVKEGAKHGVDTPVTEKCMKG